MIALSRRDKILIAPGFNPGDEKKIFSKNPVGVQHEKNKWDVDYVC
jgi:hypothetical protein